MSVGLAPFVVHIAAAPAGTVQACVSCGFTLIDNTAWTEGRAAVPDGDSDRGPAWWPSGARIATDKTTPTTGGTTYLIATDRELAEDERWCAGAN
jgi:hypothetical protein